MKLSDKELIMAFHDGQTSALEAEQVQRLIAQNPAAAEYLASLSRADEHFSKELDRLLDGPIPHRLVATARATPGKVLSITSKPVPLRPWLNQPHLALAASVVAALLLGLTAYLQPRQQPDAVRTPLASLIQNALENTPSGERLSEAAGQWVVMPTATYRSASRGLCRQFAGLDGTTPFYGISCRAQDGGDWTSLASITDSATAGQVGEQAYIPAGASGDDVADYLGDAALVSPLEEEQLIRQQWH